MRNLSEYERELLLRMLGKVGCSGRELIQELDSALVEEMPDGGMGSLRFLSQTPKGEQRLGKTIAEAEFRDEDGVLVTAALNLDQSGKLFELDIWKTDFTPLRRWPEVASITVKPR